MAFTLSSTFTAAVALQVETLLLSLHPHCGPSLSVGGPVATKLILVYVPGVTSMTGFSCAQTTMNAWCHIRALDPTSSLPNIY